MLAPCVGCTEQQREHRLAQDLEDNADKGAAVSLREGVWALRYKACGGFLPGKASTIRKVAVHAYSRATRTEHRAWRTTRAALVPSR